MKIGAQQDLTRGSALVNLWQFSFPFLLAYLLQALYNTVDLFVVGRFGNGSVSVAAVANGSCIMMFILNLISGLTTGSTVLIGQYVGAGNQEKLRRCIGTSLCLFMVCAVILTLVMLAVMPLILKLMQVPENAFEETKAYSDICVLGVIFITGYNAFSAVFRGLGNSVAPLIFVAVACVFNIIGDLILVAVFHMGAAGAAVATVAGQGISMLFAYFFMRKNVQFEFKLRNFFPDRAIVRELFRVGLPISVTGGLIDLSFMFITSIINAMGMAAAAGVGIVGRINAFAMLPALSAMGAISAITAQNIGAHKPVRAIYTLKLGIIGTMMFGIAAIILFLSVPEKIIGFFMDQNSFGARETIEAGTAYAKSFCFEYIMVPVVFCTNGFFNGCGRSFFSMLNNVLCTFVFRIPMAWYFSTMAGASLYAVGFASPLASFASNILALVYLGSGRWRKKGVRWL